MPKYNSVNTMSYFFIVLWTLNDQQAKKYESLSQ